MKVHIAVRWAAAVVAEKSATAFPGFQLKQHVRGWDEHTDHSSFTLCDGQIKRSRVEISGSLPINMPPGVHDHPPSLAPTLLVKTS